MITIEKHLFEGMRSQILYLHTTRRKDRETLQHLRLYLREIFRINQGIQESLISDTGFDTFNKNHEGEKSQPLVKSPLVMTTAKSTETVILSESIEEYSSNLNELKLENLKLLSQVEELKSTLKDAIVSYEKKIEEYLTQIESSSSKEIEALQNIIHLESRLQDFESQCKEQDLIISELQEKSQSKDEEINHLQQKQQMFMDKNISLVKQLQNLRTLNTDELVHSESLAKEYELALQSTSDRLTRLQEQFTLLTIKNTELTSKIDSCTTTMNTQQNSIIALKSKISSAESALSAAISSLTTKSTELNNLSVSYEAQSSALASTTSLLASREQELESLSNRLKTEVDLSTKQLSQISQKNALITKLTTSIKLINRVLKTELKGVTEVKEDCLFLKQYLQQELSDAKLTINNNIQNISGSIRDLEVRLLEKERERDITTYVEPMLGEASRDNAENTCQIELMLSDKPILEELTVVNKNKGSHETSKLSKDIEAKRLELVNLQGIMILKLT